MVVLVSTVIVYTERRLTEPNRRSSKRARPSATRLYTVRVYTEWVTIFIQVNKR